MSKRIRRKKTAPTAARAPHSQLGVHWLVEFAGAQGLSNTRAIRAALRAAAKAANATLLRIETHRFGDGGGVAGVALLAESHLSIHTWPEYGYAALDIFMCGTAALPERALEVLRERLAPRRVAVRRLRRGHGFAS